MSDPVFPNGNNAENLLNFCTEDLYQQIIEEMATTSNKIADDIAKQRYTHIISVLENYVPRAVDVCKHADISPSLQT